MKDKIESLKRARRFTAASLFGETPPTRPPAFSAAPRPARGGAFHSARSIPQHNIN